MRAGLSGMRFTRAPNDRSASSTAPATAAVTGTADGVAVHPHRAGSAGPVLAADVGVGQPSLLAQ